MTKDLFYRKVTKLSCKVLVAALLAFIGIVPAIVQDSMVKIGLGNKTVGGTAFWRTDLFFPVRDWLAAESIKIKVHEFEKQITLLNNGNPIMASTAGLFEVSPKVTMEQVVKLADSMNNIAIATGCCYHVISFDPICRMDHTTY